MRRVISAVVVLCVTGVGCSEPSGPESFGPRIVAVPAIACEGTTRTRAECLRNGFELDPAFGDSAFHFTMMMPVFQNPPDDAWRLLTIWVNGRMNQTLPKELGKEDPETRTVSDTIVFTWLPEAHPQVEIEISMVSGEDPRFVEPVTDTIFVWAGSANADTMRGLVPGLE